MEFYKYRSMGYFKFSREVPTTSFHNYKMVDRTGGAQDATYAYYSAHGDLA